MAGFLEPGRATRPRLTKDTIQDLLTRKYGLHMLSYKELNSYDDWNFLVKVEREPTNQNTQELCRHGYVLKVLNSLDSKNTEIIGEMDSSSVLYY